MRTWIAGIALVGFLMTGVAFAADGKAVFNAKCAGCHGPGKPMAAKLKGFSEAKLATHNHYKALSPADQAAVLAYLKTLK